MEMKESLLIRSWLSAGNIVYFCEENIIYKIIKSVNTNIRGSRLYYT